ncbi:hypothetical protein ABTW24_22760 [Sphingobacterium thalpophilum]|uniref:Uncharacterized protein n=1 Tax=Sphingobacterium thalpophilum TaxID=259 RepID=A0ABV4HIR7_9SPHI
MEIKRKEYDGVQIKAEVFMTKQSVALYKWGRVCFDIVNSEHKGKPVNEGNKEYIKAGFYKKSENNCW